MKNLRQLMLYNLITCAGLIWAVFLLMDTSWFFPGISMVGLLLATNVCMLILWLKS